MPAGEPFPDAETVTIRMVPYWCANFHVTMFPITPCPAPWIVVANPDPAITAPLFVKESEAPKAKAASPQANP